MFVVIHYQEVHRRQALRCALLFANGENSGGPFELRANRSACVRIRHRASSLGTVLGPSSVENVKEKGWANSRSGKSHLTSSSEWFYCSIVKYVII